MSYTNENYNNIKKHVLQEAMLSSDYAQTFIEAVYSLFVSKNVIKKSKINFETKELKILREDLYNLLIDLSVEELRQMVKEVL